MENKVDGGTTVVANVQEPPPVISDTETKINETNDSEVKPGTPEPIDVATKGNYVLIRVNHFEVSQIIYNNY